MNRGHEPACHEEPIMTAYAYAWDPFRDAEAMLAGMDRLFSHAYSTAGTTPGVNVYANDDAAVVTTELPGVAAGDVQVQLHDDVLTLSAERPVGATEGTLLADERAAIHFKRSISLPFAVDPDHVEARLSDGVLAVSLKRAATDRPRRIHVNAN
jgi:HSP20 family protein